MVLHTVDEKKIKDGAFERLVDKIASGYQVWRRNTHTSLRLVFKRKKVEHFGDIRIIGNDDDIYRRYRSIFGRHRTEGKD